MVHKLFAGIASAALLGLASPTFAHTGESALGHADPCPLMKYKVTSVSQHEVSKPGVRGGVLRRADGASLYVRAEPGLTAEWLQLQVTKHLAAMRSEKMPNCPFDVDGASVQVKSAGPGFVVTITSKDSDTAKEILRRAESMFG